MTAVDLAPEQQSEYERTVAAHARFFTALVTRESPRLSGAGRPDGGGMQLCAVRDLAGDMENILAALDTALAARQLEMLRGIATHLHLCLNLTAQAEVQLDVFPRLTAVARAVSDPELEMRGLIGLAHGYEQVGNYDKARTTADAALSLALSLGDQLTEARAQIQLGHLDYRQGDFFSAIERFNLALELRYEAGREIGSARALNSLGMAQAGIGMLEEGLANCQKSLAMRQALGDRQGEASVYNSLGVIARQLGRLEEAQALYEQALALRLEFGDRAGEAMALNHLAGIHFDRANYAAAIVHSTACLGICTELGYPYGIAMAHDNLARCAFKLNDDKGARRAYVEAIRLRAAMKANAELAHSLLGVAATLVRCGDYRTAALLLTGAEARAAELSITFEADYPAMLATAHALLDQAVASGALDAAEYAALQARARKLGFPTLAKLALEALDEEGLSPKAQG